MIDTINPACIVFKDLMIVSQSLQTRRLLIERIAFEHLLEKISVQDKTALLNKTRFTKLDSAHPLLNLAKLVCSLFYFVLYSLFYNLKQFEVDIATFNRKEQYLRDLKIQLEKDTIMYEKRYKDAVEQYQKEQKRILEELKPFSLRLLEKLPDDFSGFVTSFFQKSKSLVDLPQEVLDQTPVENEQEGNFNKNLANEMEPLVDQKEIAHFLASKFMPKITGLTRREDQQSTCLDLRFPKELKADVDFKGNKASFIIKSSVSFSLNKNSKEITLGENHINLISSMGTFDLKSIEFKGDVLLLKVKKAWIPQMTLNCQFEEFKEIFKDVTFA